MRAAINVLESLCGQKKSGRMAAVLGNMYEPGAGTDALHEQVGLYFAKHGGNMLYTFGEYAQNIAGGAILGGMEPEAIFRNPDIKRPELTGEMLLHSLRAGDTLLVKASRGVAAERIIEYLKANSARLL
jgi:UDP-N-acetylmuramoyl-tripeptide--D-alanyl-D-alanine ligase